jgi:glycosyltransferase involved in cell wall biosynthesis
MRWMGPTAGRYSVAEELRTVAVGISTRPFCGVRDHATLLAVALPGESVACSLRWLSLAEPTLAGSRARIGAWARELPAALAEAPLDGVLLHYSIFSFSHRGIPLFVHPTVSALRRTGIPIVTIMHEIAFPWGKGGIKGGVWAATQRAALIETMRASAAVIVTADFRADWLASRRWLPARPIEVAPVFSNLPAPAPGRGAAAGVLGLFGYALEQDSIALVLDALRMVIDLRPGTSLRLLGSPGGDSDAGRRWLAMAEQRGVAAALSFSGTLAAQELSDALAASDILLFADPTGPAPRKGTLAGSLASGRPLIALQGRRSWPRLLQADAAMVVPRSAPALADAVATMLSDPPAKEQLGARGRRFAEEDMGVARTARIVRELLDALPAARPR